MEKKTKNGLFLVLFIFGIFFSDGQNIGDIIITEIMPNPTFVTDVKGEWFEVYNTTSSDINMKNWTIKDDGSDSHTIATDLIVPANGYAVLSRNASYAVNGHVDENYKYSGTQFKLANVTDEVILMYNTTEIDAVRYSSALNFPTFNGNSLTLRDTKYTSILNDNGTNWCKATSAYNAMDFGTPRLANDDCKCDNLETVIWQSGTWSPHTPTEENNIVIKALYNTNTNGGSIEACNCRVNSGKKIIITSNNYLKVKNNILNNGTIVVRNEGSLVQVYDDATVTGSGTFKVKIKTTNLVDDNRFTYFSSPTENATLNTFSTWANMSYLWDFVGSTQNWSHITNLNTVMTPAIGYIVQPANGSTNISPSVTFNSPFNNGIKTQPMYFEVSGAPDATDASSTLVGNPYPSAINSDILFQKNPQLGGIYIWNHDSALGNSTNSYGDWMNNDYIVCAAGNNCTNAPSNGTNAAHSGYIASGQGFFATANTTNPADLVFNNAMRITGNNTDFRRPTINIEKLWLNLTSTNGYFSQALFLFSTNGTPNYDNQADARRLGSNYGLAFYGLAVDTNYRLAVDDSGVFQTNITVPVGFYLNNDTVTSLTFSIDHFENLDGVHVYLKDNLLQITHDLKISDYTFAIANTGIYENRFELFFSRNVLSIENNTTRTNSLMVTNQNDAICFKMLNTKKIKNIKGYDPLGKLVLETNTNSENIQIKTNIQKGSILFFKVFLENGQTITKKFIKE